MRLFRNKKIIIILVVAIFFSISGFKVVVAAESAIKGTTSVVVYTAAMGITFLAGKIVSALYTAIAGLIDIAIRANALILSSPIVLSGWQIVLSFANLGFVLAIIVIAFATIFRLQSYAMKQILWKLIVAALLVNFSLVIAGAFINVADNVTSSFNKKIKGADVSTALTGLLEVQTFTSPVWEKMTGAERYSRGVLKATDALLDLVTLNWYTYLTGGMEKSAWGDTQSALSLVTGEKNLKSESLLLIIGSIFFSVLFTFLSALTLLAVAVMMFIRYFFLGVLLILSPIVWLLWIFPGTSSLWQKWWNNFLRWTFFAPIMMFFLYLAIATISVENLKDAKLQGAIQGSQQFTENLAKKQEGGLVVDIAKFGNLALVIGLIMSGLIAANSMGIYGAKTAMGVAQGAGKWMGGAVGGIAGRGAKGIGKRILTSGAREEIDPKTGKKTGEVTTRGQRFAATLSRIPVLRGAASKISNITSGRTRKEEVEKYGKENLTNLSNDAVINKANAKMAFLNPVEAAAMGQELAKRGLTDKLNPDKVKNDELMKKYVKTAKNLGAEEPILNNRPDLAGTSDDPRENSENIKRVTNKIKAGKAEEIHHKSFENIEVVANLDGSKLERLSREGSTQQKDTILNTIKTTLGSALAPIETAREYLKKTQQGIVDAQASGNAGLVSQLITERDILINDEKTLVSGLGAQEQKLLKHHDFISNNVNWQA